MVPREKMAALELNTPPDKVLEAVRTGAHTRMPVYEGDLDNIVGIVNTKDLFYLFSLQGVVVLQDALYPAAVPQAGREPGQAPSAVPQGQRPMALVRDERGPHPRPDYAGRRAGRDRRRHRGRTRPAGTESGSRRPSRGPSPRRWPHVRSLQEGSEPIAADSIPQQPPEQVTADRADEDVGAPHERERLEFAFLGDAGAAQHQRVIDEHDRQESR